jgi:hypothetical protein
MYICNCVSIFWFIVRNAKNPQKFQNEFQWTTKHVFWQDYSMHMRPAPKAGHFETIQHNCFVKWLKKLSPLPCNPCLQNFEIFL